jgi:outer membrane protein OmpA-like peptidoglycan-associated protein
VLSARRWFGWILLSSAALFVSPCEAAKKSSRDFKSGWRWADAHLGADVALQGGGSSFSAIARYVPEYRSSEGLRDKYFGAGFDLGITGFINAARPRFLVLEVGAFGSYHLDEHWDFRLFVGAQNWTDGQGVGLFFGPKVLYHFESEPGILGIDGLFLSYDAVLLSNFAHILSLGVVFDFSSGDESEPVVVVKQEAPTEQKKIQEENIKQQQKDLSAVVDSTRTANGLLVNLKGDMTFKVGSSTLSPSGSDAVGRMGEILAKYPNSKIRVEGHSDSTGQAESNMKLSQARAEGVRARLVEKGVAPGDGRALNRRVEIYIDTPANQ